MMTDPSIVRVVSDAVKSGKFGENCTFEDLVLKSDQGEDHFASDVVFAQVKLRDSSREKAVDVVIKKQQHNQFVREAMNTDAQFYNEALMYSELIPFLDKNKTTEELFPKLIYGCATLGENYKSDILVVEDLRQYGYALTKERLFLDFEHCALALKKLGRFHALSYSAKQGNLDEFLIKIGKLKEVRLEKDQKEESNRFLSTSMERGVLSLLEAGEHIDAMEKFMEKVQEPFALMKDLCRPEEPTAVLCHGDFCRNNMVFRYDDAGKPEDVRFFDVATARYASPAIDIVFFLFLNTTSELRSARWDDLLRAYHDSLESAIPGCRVPSLDIIRLEVARKAVYGYILCSFFIPMMMDATDKMEMEEFASMTPEQVEQLTRTRGGEKATEAIMDILRDLVKLNSL